MALVLICIVVLFILCQSVKIIPDIYEALTCNHSQVSIEREKVKNRVNGLETRRSREPSMAF